MIAGKAIKKTKQPEKSYVTVSTLYFDCTLIRISRPPAFLLAYAPFVTID